MSYGYENGCRCAACTSKHYAQEKAQKDGMEALKKAIAAGDFDHLKHNNQSKDGGSK